MKGDPCYECKDRWVSDTSRCHVECEKYIEWRQGKDVENKTILDNKQQYNEFYQEKIIARKMQSNRRKNKRRSE